MRSTCAHVQDLTHTFERPNKIASCNAIQQYITADIPTAAQLYRHRILSQPSIAATYRTAHRRGATLTLSSHTRTLSSHTRTSSLTPLIHRSPFAFATCGAYGSGGLVLVGLVLTELGPHALWMPMCLAKSTTACAHIAQLAFIYNFRADVAHYASSRWK